MEGTRRQAGRLAPLITTVLGSSAISGPWRRLRPGLRILAYHGVPDRTAFAAQLDHLVRHHRIVSGAEVAAAIHDDGPSVDGAVWLTFDDAEPTALSNGLPLLVERSIPATLYVCPGLLDPPRPPWWTVVREAGLRGEGAALGTTALMGQDLVVALKMVPDEQRREIVAGLEGDRPVGVPDATTFADIERWVDAGLEVGNHTWDHPCLDMCSPEEQTRQVVSAHERLTEFLGAPPLSFAYPNGNRSDHVAELAERLGYRTVLLYDHAVSRPTPGEIELSRLRLDADAPLARARAVSSGAHGDTMAAGQRIRNLMGNR